jgi:23S rRNA pseudouridine2605 synthase
MAKRNSPTGGRRAGRTGAGKSSDKPFKKNERGGERPRKGPSSKPSFRKRDEDSTSRPSRSGGSPYKKSDKPFGKPPSRKRSESSDERGGKSFNRESRGGSSERPYKKSDKSFSSSPPRRKRIGESSEGRESKSFNREDRKGSDKPFSNASPRRRSGDSSEGRESKSFNREDRKKTDRPYGESAGRSSGFEGRKDSDAGSRSERPKKFDKPYGKPADRDSGFEGKKERSAEEKRSSDSYGLPYKRAYDKSSLKKGPPRGADNKENEVSKSSADSQSDRPYPKKVSAKREVAADAAPKDPDIIRLNRYIANSGLCSRREADEFITMGLVSVNGNVITELGHKVRRSDEVRYEGKVLRAEKPVYILMNKPKGYITTTKDPQERNTVMHILGETVKERVYPVGRLDRNTTGLLLLTNDGELADKLMHPSYQAKKIYKVELNRPLTQPDFEKIQTGVFLEEGRAVVDEIAMLEDKQTVGVEIHIGWNRVVRRIFEALGYEVVKLDRTVYAGLDKKDLARGEWRYLKNEEVVRLKHYNK